MKLRIQGNSLRLRLGPREVARLLAAGLVAETTRLGPAPDQQFRYALRTDVNAAELAVRFDRQGLDVVVPATVARAWANSSQVEMRGEQFTGTGDVLRVLVEKDFECLDHPEADADVDVFPHPAVGTACG